MDKTNSRHDTEVLQGEFWALGILVEDGAGNPFDFTGWTGEFVIRESVASEQSLLRKNVTFPSSDPEKNVLLEMTATETLNLSDTFQRIRGVYEVRVWDPNDKEGTADRILEGVMAIVPSVSREDV